MVIKTHLTSLSKNLSAHHLVMPKILIQHYPTVNLNHAKHYFTNSTTNSKNDFTTTIMQTALPSFLDSSSHQTIAASYSYSITTVPSMPSPSLQLTVRP